MDDPIKEKLRDVKCQTILDVATGQGNLIGYLKELFPDSDEIVGIDNSPKAIKAAKEKFHGNGYRFEQMDASEMRFDNNYFDAVAVSNSLHHFAEPKAILNETYRVLKPGGLLMVFEMFRDNQNRSQQIHVLLHHWWAAVDSATGIVHNETYSRNEILDMVANLGLSEFAVFDYADPDDDAREEKRIQWMKNIYKDYFARIEGKPEYTKLLERGKELMKRLDEHGITWATMIGYVGKK